MLNRPLTIPTRRRPTPPGAILWREFLEPLDMTQAAFAKHRYHGSSALGDHPRPACRFNRHGDPLRACARVRR